MKNLHVWTLALLLLAVVLQWLNYYPQLPNVMVSQFDGHGNPTSQMTKGAFSVLYWVTMLIMLLIFIVLPPAMKRLPTSMWSLPNRDYWLAPERRDTTIAVIREYMFWCGFGMILFFMFLFQFTVSFHASGRERMSMTGFWILITAFAVFITVWTVAFVMQFRKQSA
ncbi:hypothetical protein JW935_12165 [candidate division KSB1 bacterium]|nr:hypothetical protein [candidate division KSB1 bacterium]